MKTTKQGSTSRKPKQVVKPAKKRGVTKAKRSRVSPMKSLAARILASDSSATERAVEALASPQTAPPAPEPAQPRTLADDLREANQAHADASWALTERSQALALTLIGYAQMNAREAQAQAAELESLRQAFFKKPIQ